MKVLQTLKLFGGLVVLLVTTSERSYAATISFITDFDIFNQSATTSLVEDFETFVPQNTRFPSFSSNGNNYTAISSDPLPLNIVVTSAGRTNYGVPVTTSSVLTSAGDENFRVDFGSPSRAIGFDTYLNSFGPAIVNVFGSTGLLDTFTLNQDSTQVGFLGIVADDPITSIEWATTNGRQTNTGIDNILQGEPISSEPVSSVPEPSLVFTLGLVSVFSFFNKKKKVI